MNNWTYALLIIGLLLFVGRRFHKSWKKTSRWGRFRADVLLQHLQQGNKALVNGDVVIVDNWSTGVRLHFKKFNNVFDFMVASRKESYGAKKLSYICQKFGFRCEVLSLDATTEVNFIEIDPSKIEKEEFILFLECIGLNRKLRYFLSQYGRILLPEKQSKKEKKRRAAAFLGRYSVDMFAAPSLGNERPKQIFDTIDLDRLDVFDPDENEIYET